MKWLFLFILSFSAMAQTLSEQMEKKRYYFSALNEFFIETYNKSITEAHVERLEYLLFFTGIELLEDYDHALLEKYPTSSTRFILGRRSFQKKDFKKAIGYFDKVHKDHRYFPEGQLLKAQVYGEQKDYDKESETYFSCQKAAEKEEGKVDNEKIKRYYRMIYEVCLINKARRLYKLGKYQDSLDSYNQIPKQSYKWPYILLEKAWAYFMMGDYNRALGLLLTYKSPLLDTYFFPEAEYLSALIYYRLCLYDDALVLINQYHQFYHPRFNQLETILEKNRSSQNFFYNLMFNSGNDLEKQEEFIRQIVSRLKKQTRFSLDFNLIHKLDLEIARIKKNEKKQAHVALLDHLGLVRENMINKINYNAKTDIFHFLDSVPFYSTELFKLNLEIISKKKDLVYANQKLISGRVRGDYSNVKRSRFEQFWKFEGDFWADELGEYSLGLKSNCQKVRLKNEEE